VTKRLKSVITVLLDLEQSSSVPLWKVLETRSTKSIHDQVLHTVRIRKQLGEQVFYTHVCMHNKRLFGSLFSAYDYMIMLCVRHQRCTYVINA
jgi:hypothetical protein